MLDTINEHIDEVKSIHNMNHQVAQLLVKTNESNNALKIKSRALKICLITIREKYPLIAKGKSNNHPRDPQVDPHNEGINPHQEQPIKLISTTPQPNIRSGTKPTLSKAQTELSAKTAVLEQLYADQVPADHLNLQLQPDTLIWSMSYCSD
ncbi:hypothetical protein M422DRAFT_248881 [Sphaerobolus stellatus SS14]|nr:hypothetical protein M422DRAFT_248881 [Sphaerobolus stellatus SS14]